MPLRNICSPVQVLQVFASSAAEGLLRDESRKDAREEELREEQRCMDNCDIDFDS